MTRRHTTLLIAYLRVSTDEQAESGLGLDAQEHAITIACDRGGWTIGEVVRDEGQTGANLQRPGLRRALRAISRGEADGLIVSRLDRLTRSLGDFGALMQWFQDSDAVFVSLQPELDMSTAAGRLVANVYASVVEWERGVISERTTAALAALRARGRPTGRPAVADRPEIADRIRTMRDAGHTLQSIADTLNADGIPTPRGGARWRTSSVQTVVGYKRRPRKRKPTRLPPIRKRP
jgi:DNA invertase Pin-like site-specific DNA recombinase